MAIAIGGFLQQILARECARPMALWLRREDVARFFPDLVLGPHVSEHAIEILPEELPPFDRARNRAALAKEMADDVTERAEASGVAHFSCEAQSLRERMTRATYDFVRAVEWQLVGGLSPLECALNYLEATEREAHALSRRMDCWDLLEEIKALPVSPALASALERLHTLIGIDVLKIAATSRGKLGMARTDDTRNLWAVGLEVLWKLRADAYTAGEPWRAMLEGRPSKGVTTGFERQIRKLYAEFGTAGRLGLGDLEGVDRLAVRRLSREEPWQPMQRVDAAALAGGQSPSRARPECASSTADTAEPMDVLEAEPMKLDDQLSAFRELAAVAKSEKELKFLLELALHGGPVSEAEQLSGLTRSQVRSLQSRARTARKK